MAIGRPVSLTSNVASKSISVTWWTEYQWKYLHLLCMGRSTGI